VRAAADSRAAEAQGVIEREKEMEVNIGDRLKKVRLEKGYTLKDVAAKSGYSKALISRIENGNVSPSINSLLKIASALEVKPHDLFLPAKDAEPTVVHKTDRKKVKVDGGKAEVEFLTVQTGDKKIEPLLITVERGASTGSEIGSHNGEVWTMQLKGRMELMLGEKTHTLEEGDCAYFKSSIPHSFRNVGKSKSVAFCVITPPRN
jgi:transcriptional regulator with XRE-family HTH domain